MFLARKVFWNRLSCHAGYFGGPIVNLKNLFIPSFQLSNDSIIGDLIYIDSRHSVFELNNLVLWNGRGKSLSVGTFGYEIPQFFFLLLCNW